MKFSCLQENLSHGLNMVGRVAGISKAGLPILSNILLTAKKGSLKLTTTNLEIAVESKVRAKIEKEGQITIPAQLLVNYIELLPNEPISFELIKTELNIKTKNQKSKIKGISAEEFPIIPQIEKKIKYSIKGEELKNALEKTLFTISPSETRVEISGALFAFNYPSKNKLTIVGTDSYRLAEKIVDFNSNNGKNEKRIIIPTRALQELLKIIKDGDQIEIYLSDNQILFIYQDTELISRIINGEYPDYRQIIPEGIRTKIIVNREDFLRTIKATSFFSKSGINDIVLKFSSKENKIQVSSLNNQVGESHANIKAEITGEQNEITFNYRYLIDGLNNASGEEVLLDIVNDNTPGKLTSEKDKDYLYLIMPIKNN